MCTEKSNVFDINDYCDDDFESDVQSAHDDGFLSNDVFALETDDMPCYFGHLGNAEYAKDTDIPVLMELAFAHVAHDESLIMVSVASHEKNHKIWLDAAEGYPGATIQKIVRNKGCEYTVYNLMFPATPTL